MDARVDVNVALRRPSFQPSTYITEDGIYYHPEYANDGGTSTDVLALSCAHTDTETNPWWAVDLTVPLYVHSIRFSNRDSNGEHAIL